MTDGPAPIELRPSWRVFVSGGLSTNLLVVVPAAAMLVVGRLAIVALVLVLLGVTIGAFTVFDTPQRTVIDHTGVLRRCPGRIHHIPWSRVDSIGRALALTQARRRDDQGNAGGRRPGGLTANVGKRRYMLTDVAETDAQHEALAAALAIWCPEVLFRAAPPAKSVDTRRDRH